jgi:BASS family bile acid:Na+ symporter
MLQRFLIVWLGISSLAAFYWSRWFPTAFDPFVESKPLLDYLIVVTMLAIGLMLPKDEVAQVARRWPAVLAGTALQYVTMPTLAYVMSTLFGMSGDYRVGIVMVGCVPGAMASNVLTLNARGNTSYSVSLTTMATILSPLAVPLAMAVVLGADQAVDRSILLASSKKLLLIVVIPVIAGHAMGRYLSNWERYFKSAGSTLANLTILWIIAAVVGLTRDPLSRLRLDLLWALLALNLGGYLAGYFGGWALRLPVPMRRALTLEIGMQNAGLGAVLATSLFGLDRPATAIAPAMYTFGCMLTGTLLSHCWSAIGTSSERS